jgi:hypothetical protein
MTEQASQQMSGEIISVSGKFPTASGKATTELLPEAGNPEVTRMEGGSLRSNANVEFSVAQSGQVPWNASSSNTGFRNPRLKSHLSVVFSLTVAFVTTFFGDHHGVVRVTQTQRSGMYRRSIRSGKDSEIL